MLVLPSASAAAPARWGTLADGRAVELYRLTNTRGMTVELTDLGAAIVAIRLPGDSHPVTVGPIDFATFAASRRRYGAIVGRYAGRLPGAITIAGRRYPLAVNASGVTLHGGDPGFDRALWTARRIGRNVIEFNHQSPAGAQGFPGQLVVRARYTLAPDSDTLTLDLSAQADRPTAANLTNHVYFNLAGAGSIGCHRLRVAAGQSVTLDARRVPAGTAPVAPELDFRHPRALAAALMTGGLDALLLLDAPEMMLDDPTGGLRLTLSTSEPAIQVFTGNSFDGTERDGKGVPIARFAGIALEPQRLPAGAAEVTPRTGLVSPGRPQRSTTQWRFDRIAKGACA